MALLQFQRYECTVGNSSKFWLWELHLVVQGMSSYDLTFRWGRIGSDGQSMTKKFSSRGRAIEMATAKSMEKLAKGYTPCSAASWPDSVWGAPRRGSAPPTARNRAAAVERVKPEPAVTVLSTQRKVVLRD